MKAAAVMALALACATSAYAQAGGGKAATEKALIANENKLNEAVAKGDLPTFKSFIAPDAMSADGSGIMPVAEFIKEFSQIKITAWKITDPKVMWVDDKTAVVLYTWTGKGTFAGQPVPEKTFTSTVWTDKGGKWMAVYHQESAAMAPPPPPRKK